MEREGIAHERVILSLGRGLRLRIHTALYTASCLYCKGLSLSHAMMVSIHLQTFTLKTDDVRTLKPAIVA